MQSTSADTLLALRLEPQEMEALYRQRPEGFAEALADALDRRPDDLVLQTWAARLDLAPVAEREEAPPAWRFASVLTPERALGLLGLTVTLIALAGTWAKVPSILGWTTWDYQQNSEVYRADQFYQRYLPFAVLLPLVGLFVARYRPSARTVAAVGGAVLGLLAVQSFRPIDTDPGTLSIIHLPLTLLSLGGVAALGARWRNAEARLGFLQLMGETVALAGVFLLGGAILIGLTIALFNAIGVQVEAFVFEWVAVYGAIGVLPVGALLASQRVEAARLAPLVARVFGPLALVVFAAYVPTLILSGGLGDRDSLLILNVALVAVLALVILMEAERPDRPRVWTDGVAAALVGLALVADLFAFGSIASRLAGGLTPNRLAVVGMNLLVAVHFAGLVMPLARRAVGAGPGPEDAWTARFLTVYALWSLTVVLVFPILF